MLTSCPSLSHPSINVTTEDSNAWDLTQQGNIIRTPTEVDTVGEGPSWLFNLTSPTALDYTLCTSSGAAKPLTTTVSQKIDFPALPTDSQRDIFARLVFATYTRDRSTKSTTILDPYRLDLNITTISFAAGFFSNTLHLGLVEHEYCHPTAQSNFYCPGIASSPYAETMILAVQRSFDGLKPDLRPTSEQITTPHHPVLDVCRFRVCGNDLLKVCIAILLSLMSSSFGRTSGQMGLCAGAMLVRN